MRNIAIVTFLVIATAALAAGPTITPMDQCGVRSEIIGNPYADNAGATYDQFWFGEEEYAVLIDPTAAGFPCPEGFAVTSINMLLGLDLTANLQVQGAIREAVEDGGVYTPGDEIYATDIYLLADLPSEGFYEIGLPASAECLPVDVCYFLVFRFLDSDADQVIIPVDDSPTVGYGYSESGFGWLDLVDYFGMVGDVYVSADVDACQDVVPVQNSSWSGVKGLFE